MSDHRDIISHVRTTDMAVQLNEEHQLGVAKLAEKFADIFGMGPWGRVMGLLHDKGKEKYAFQQHIKKESGLDPSCRVDGDYTHAYVGALIAKRLFPQYAPLITNPMAGHHRGLYDYGDLQELLKAALPEEIEVANFETVFTIPAGLKRKDFHHLQRFLYSCLVDADYLDTESFMMPEQHRLRKRDDALETFDRLLASHLSDLKSKAPVTEVNQIRAKVQQWCIQESEGRPGFYSLTVPTGGGKTLSSVLWALKHAIKNHLQRVIIAIPYTSIITQTAQVLRNIFGEENVLEHHSMVNDSDDDSEMTKIQKLATENWDYPIVLTTNVQFFESLFSNRPSDCRKLHNIAKSVIILDEVQALPINFLRPIIDTLDTLQRVFGASVLFTTASQPILKGQIVGVNRLCDFEALPEIKEIIPNGENLHERLQRTKLVFDDDRHSYDEIAARLSGHRRVLCIVNTRKDAKEIFSRLPEEGHRIHLSRMMCSDHVKTAIEHIKQILKNDDGTAVRVVATQLIEAGVDIDFPVVYRQEAGLDSVLQAAGRCNREGKLPVATTYVFGLQNNLPPGFITKTNNARLALGTKNDWFSPEVMTEYFRQLYSREDEFDKPNVNDMLYCPEMQFELVAKDFHLISDKTKSVIVNWGNSLELVSQLRERGSSYRLLKKLSQFSVNVRLHDFNLLQEAGAIEEVLEGIYVVFNSSFYDKEVGLITSNQWLEETLIK